jgi:pimeloyl-ACP methyl ester carboxylesterase
MVDFGDAGRGRQAYGRTVESAMSTELFHSQAGDGAPILLIHGAGGDADVWGEAFDLLAKKHRVIAYDRRGFTQSKQEPVADLDRHADDAAELLGELKAAPTTVVGWSSGGVVALELAIRRPECVARLVLIEPPLHLKRAPGIQGLWGIAKARVLNLVKDDRAASDAFFRWAFLHTSGGNYYDRLEPKMREAIRANGRATMIELKFGTGERLKGQDIAAIACPVTCLTGELSDRALLHATRKLVRLLPRAQVREIAGAGHTLHLERPQEFAAAVTDAVAV